MVGWHRELVFLCGEKEGSLRLYFHQIRYSPSPHSPLPGSSLSCQAGTPGVGEGGKEESSCEASVGSPEVFQICY